MNKVETLSLMRGTPQSITKFLTLYQPTLGDIEKLGYSNYRAYVSVLTCGRIEYADILWCENQVWYEDIESDWTLFLSMAVGQKKDCKLYLKEYDTTVDGVLVSDIYRDALNFFLGLTGEYALSVITRENTQQTVLYNVKNENDIYIINEDSIVFAEMSYNLLAQMLRQINWINQDFDFLKGGNKRAKKYILKHDYDERKVQRKQYITFDTIVSFVECHLGNPTSVWDLPVYTLYDMYFRYNKMSNYQDTLNKLNAGCIDTKKHPINWEKINWASSIN